MIGFNIPKEDIIVLSKLIELDNSQFSLIEKCFINLPIALTPVILKNRLKETSIKNIEQISDVIFKLMVSVSKRTEIDDSDIITGLFDEFREIIPKSKISLERFTERFLILLKFKESFKVFYRVLALRQEIGNYITDIDTNISIKPIFLNGAETKAIGSIIIHTLKIEYSNDINNEEDKEIIFSFDKDDLIKLKELIEIAEKQQIELEQKLAETGLNIIDF